ncbi:MAG: hypothetical protein ACK4IT_08990 [Thioalkalivibrionaceae bacterium]
MNTCLENQCRRQRSRTTSFYALTLAAGLLLPFSLSADPVREALDNAIEAYESGDIQYALEELALAQQALNELKTGQLAEFLPEAPSDWTRTIETSTNSGAMAMFGGGSSVEAVYSGPNGQSITMTIMADNPMLAMYAGAFSNPQLMNQMGTVHRIGRERAVEQDGQFTMVVGGRYLIQASGGDADNTLPLLNGIDFRALASFGS